MKKKYINLLNTVAPNGYNLSLGGNNSIVTDEYRQKMSKIMKGVAFWKGKKFSKEHITNMIKSRKGIKHSEEHKRKIGLKSLGRKHTNETKVKMSILHKGHKRNPCGTPRNLETKLKIGLGNQGEKCANSKLKNEQVVEIRLLYNLYSYKINDLSLIYNVNYNTITDVIKGKTWKHLL